MFAAWLGGLGPGILATLLSLIAAFYFIISASFTASHPSSAHAVGAILFVGVSVFISALNEALRRSRARSDERFQELTLETVRRRRVEEALAGSIKEAEGDRDLLHTILSSIGDAVIATDREGKVTFLNPVAQDLTGWSQEDAVGKPSSEVFVIRDERTLVPSEIRLRKCCGKGSPSGWQTTGR